MDGGKRRSRPMGCTARSRLRRGSRSRRATCSSEQVSSSIVGSVGFGSSVLRCCVQLYRVFGRQVEGQQL